MGNPASALRTVLFVALVALATLQGSLSLWGFTHDAAVRDFGHFIQSARSWHASGVLYAGEERVNLNPPHVSVLLFTPLTWISFDSAVRFWLVMQVMTLLASIVLIARELHLAPARLEWIVPAIVGSAMTIHNWSEGQVGGVLAVVGAVAWRAARRNREGEKSAALAALLSLKPQLGLILLGTNVRTALRVALIGGACLAASIILMGPAVWISWLSMIQSKGLQLPPWNVSIPSTLYRGGVTIMWPVYFPLAALMFALTWRSTLSDADMDRAWLLWGLVTLLIAPIAWVYYAAAFLGPLISWGERYRWPRGAQAGVLLWLIPVEAQFWGYSSPPGWQNGIIASAYTWGALLLWFSVLTAKLRPAL